ncbi:hypothetical protein BVC80_8611g22 [Macleaya cordata]|uniref:Uncharacterized protein n=1 Tax=Macleaya cordata TaxID=56857 RepID=A0A200QK19_MACCD|nr:hypothetical protein BVC80_8611g22 [Macleaya cordata]
MDGSSLKEEFHRLFKISRSKDASIHDHTVTTATGREWQFQFTKEPGEADIPQLAAFLHKIDQPPHLNDSADSIQWSADPTCFSISHAGCPRIPDLRRSYLCSLFLQMTL